MYFEDTELHFFSFVLFLWQHMSRSAVDTIFLEVQRLNRDGSNKLKYENLQVLHGKTPNPELFIFEYLFLSVILMLFKIFSL